MQIRDEFQSINDYFAPKIIGEVNDAYIKIAKIKGHSHPWHYHKHEDKMLYILEGELMLEIENEESSLLSAGDLYIVKKGMNHRLSSENESKILLIESKTVKHLSNRITNITRSIVEQYYD
ncbi:MAG: cupin domain-containing protein [Cytophagales bacterium]|nr:cupin domain-containing protein [Cytophagales bacterium]